MKILHTIQHKILRSQAFVTKSSPDFEAEDCEDKKCRDFSTAPGFREAILWRRTPRVYTPTTSSNTLRRLHHRLLVVNGLFTVERSVMEAI